VVKIGARYLDGNRCEFTLWAPLLDQVAVKLVAPTEQLLPMQPGEHGYWQVTAEDVQPGTRYFYDLGEFDRPDPASQFQPEGVHGPSEVVDHQAFNWTDQDWSGIPLDEMVIYELHVGTFTPEGTFEAIASRLKELRELGVNAIEIMPVAQFPGSRNWGYDGVYPFAVQNSYGGPDGLKQLVNICHQEGFAIILDVVYNHFGPEGNYTSNFAPFFTETYKTPWGSAINFDDAHSEGVRNYFIENALYWFEQFHFDALRLDAIHAIYDLGAKHFLKELADDVAALSKQVGRKLYLIAESDLNDVRVIREPELGGHGMDAQWSDDFHHCLHTLLTGEQIGYYQDFGTCEQLAKAYKNSFVYDWQYAAERKRYHGSDASDRPGYQFVICTQNHDQVGNRMLGDRLSTLVSFEALKLAAGALLLSPNIPMLFMGEEYGEESPFLYFVSHTDPALVEAVREGRKREFSAFHLEGEYSDPQSPETFKQSQLKWEKQKEGKHRALRDLYQHLISLRRTVPALKNLDKQNLEATVQEEKKLLFLYRWQDSSKLFCVLNFNNEEVSFNANIPNDNWRKILDSADQKWMGSGAALPDSLASKTDLSLTIPAQSFAVYQA
jgi:maltooligosyltrehalose trehalohydrolase